MSAWLELEYTKSNEHLCKYELALQYSSYSGADHISLLSVTGLQSASTLFKTIFLSRTVFCGWRNPSRLAAWELGLVFFFVDFIFIESNFRFTAERQVCHKSVVKLWPMALSSASLTLFRGSSSKTAHFHGGWLEASYPLHMDISPLKWHDCP